MNAIKEAAWDEYFAITPHDTTNLSSSTKGGVYVGGTGAVVAVRPDGTTVTFTSVPAGSILPAEVIRVNATGTTATSLVGFN